MNKDINFFGLTNFRNQQKKFGIMTIDRQRHIYIVGKSGTGKTTLIRNMAIQDIRSGRGVAFIDPHGEVSEELLDYVPKERIEDVCYFDPADRDYPISFNVMESVDEDSRTLVASGLMEVFKEIWPDVWSARMEYILNNSLLALIESPNTTLLSINRMFADAEYGKEIVSKIKDPIIKSYWIGEFESYGEKYQIEATAAIQNKIGQFISSTIIRNIVGQERSTIDMRRMMDEEKIMIFNLSKGKIGEDNAKLLGGLVITKLQLAAMSRVDIPENQRKDLFLYVDEFQNFATESFCNILSEARKYHLDLTVAHQYIAQMEEPVRDAVFGNVGTMICFRVGAEDGEFLEKEFSPTFLTKDLVDLPNRAILLKLMVNGIVTKPFSAVGMPPLPKEPISNKEAIINSSRKKYAGKKEDIENRLADWMGDFVKSQASSSGGGKKSFANLYDAKCDECGEVFKVPFKPEPGRSIFCKKCLKDRKESGVSDSPKKPEKTTDRDNDDNKKIERVDSSTISKSVQPGHMTLEQLLTRQQVNFKKHKKDIDVDKVKNAIKDALAEDDEEEEGIDMGGVEPPFKKDAKIKEEIKKNEEEEADDYLADLRDLI